jgi:hypothetical protein
MSNINNIPDTGDTDATRVFFNNFFKPEFTVSTNVDAAMTAFFEKITNSKESARILASSVIYTSLATNIDPMETLADFAKLEPRELNNYTTLFLNLNRVGTSYLGVTNAAKVGKYVERTLLP